MTGAALRAYLISQGKLKPVESQTPEELTATVARLEESTSARGQSRATKIAILDCLGRLEASDEAAE
jgi:hypothetical protein